MTGELHPLSGVPTTVLLTLGLTRDEAYQYGMIGCGLQLDSTGEFDWAQTTITLSPDKEEVMVFLKVRGIEYSLVPTERKPIRVRILDFEDYVLRYVSIQKFLDGYRRNRFLRLGERASRPAWELDSHDAFLLGMDDDQFRSSFVSDPRGQPTFSEVARGVTRHAPYMLARPQGLPDPGQGGWI